MKKVIFHIGHDKTATCSIQDTFKNNATLLLNSGYYYPLPDGHTHHNRLFIVLFKEDLYSNKNLLLSHEIEPSRIDKIRNSYKQWLIEKLIKTKAKTIVFSGEYFPNFNVNELIKIKHFFKQVFVDVEYEVHMYTREPISYASSSYQQRARLFPSNTKVIFFPYKNNIFNYIKIFGKQHVNLYKFEDACEHENGPVHYLIDKLGVSKDILGRMRLEKNNDRMSDLSVDLLLYINNRIPYKVSNITKGLRRRFDCKELITLPGKKYRIDVVDAKKIVEKTGDNIDWLNDVFKIQYSFDDEVEMDLSLMFSEAYVEQMKLALQEVNPIIRKLIYDYLNEKLKDSSLDEATHDHLEEILRYINESYAFTIKLTYAQLALPQKLYVQFYDFLKQSEILRKIKRKWIS